MDRTSILEKYFLLRVDLLIKQNLTQNSKNGVYGFR